METDAKNQELERSLKELMGTLPSAVSNYLTEEKYVVVVSRLMGRLGLTEKQGAILEREIILLLLGAEVQEDFVQALLEEAELKEELVEEISKEVRVQIFDFLEKRMSEDGISTTAQKPPIPVAPQPPKPKPVQMPLPSYSSAPPLQSPRYVRPESAAAIDAAIAPLTPRAGAPRPAVTLDPLANGASAPAPAQREATPEPPAPKAVPMPAVPAVAPLAELPVGEGAAPAPTMPVQPLAPQAPAPTPPATVTQPPPPAQPPREFKTPPVPVREVGVGDPYREPIDEKDR